MKLAYNELSTVIEIDSEFFTGIVIENPEFMYRMLREIKRAVAGEDTRIVISVDDKPVTISKMVSYITDFVNFSINQKSLLTKLISEIDNNSKNETYYNETYKLLAEIESYIIELTNGFPCEINCEKLNMFNVIKAVGVEVEDDYESLEEELLAYMDLSREFEGKKLFIFINLRSVISDERLQLMMETALKREHMILLIDNVGYKRLDCERRLIVDKDLCEI